MTLYRVRMLFLLGS